MNTSPNAPSVDELTLCSVCNKAPAIGRGLCRTHYTAAYRKGALPPNHREVRVRVKFHITLKHDRRMRRIMKASGMSYASLLRSAVGMFLESRGVQEP